jgi:MinD-like ATPase involved in chromosome partitioning or flagellar assembly
MSFLAIIEKICVISRRVIHGKNLLIPLPKNFARDGNFYFASGNVKSVVSEIERSHGYPFRSVAISFPLDQHPRTPILPSIMTQIVSVHSYRGGTGKSNLTANLATTVALSGKRVGIVDTDIQSPGIHILFRLDETKIKKTLNDYLWDEQCHVKQIAYDVSSVINGQNSNGKIFLIPSSMKSEDIATILSEGYDVELLQKGFQELSDYLQLDYLFIDTHPGLNEETLLSIGLSNILVVILRPDQQDYLGTAVIVEVARELEVPKMLLVVNKALTDFDFGILKEKVCETYQLPVAGVLPLSTEMLRLGSQGLFTLHHPDHVWSQELRRIANHL